MYTVHVLTSIFKLISTILSGFDDFCHFSPAEMAETKAEILSPLFLPLVRQKYLSARQKTNTATI